MLNANIYFCIITKEQIGLFKSYSGVQCCFKVMKLGYTKVSKTI